MRRSESRRRCSRMCRPTHRTRRRSSRAGASSSRGSAPTRRSTWRHRAAASPSSSAAICRCPTSRSTCRRGPSSISSWRAASTCVAYFRWATSQPGARAHLCRGQLGQSAERSGPRGQPLCAQCDDHARWLGVDDALRVHLCERAVAGLRSDDPLRRGDLDAVVPTPVRHADDLPDMQRLQRPGVRRQRRRALRKLRPVYRR